MRLTIPERIVLLGLLPAEEDYAGMKEVIKTKMGLAFTAEEVQDFQIASESNQIRWNSEGNTYIADIPISEWMTNVVRVALFKMEKDHKLQERHLSVYEKFIVDYDKVNV